MPTAQQIDATSNLFVHIPVVVVIAIVALAALLLARSVVAQIARRNASDVVHQNGELIKGYSHAIETANAEREEWYKRDDRKTAALEEQLKLFQEMLPLMRMVQEVPRGLSEIKTELRTGLGETRDKLEARSEESNARLVEALQVGLKSVIIKLEAVEQTVRDENITHRQTSEERHTQLMGEIASVRRQLELIQQVTSEPISNTVSVIQMPVINSGDAKDANPES